ncbi:MFS transporter [Nisaea acidiphila]|uniref:MFS transporter n=1 Tax=Nisaea acidiphila TaxID=1862145 RepID=A0A9J7AU69_9PROT|nr:MFS transporter [Nisaea acidiphila]UUX48933.1 MFS transporter [Nisaea acidiphila]
MSVASILAVREVDSPYAWFRLSMSLLISMIGGVGLWSVVVTLPAIEADFGIARGDASLPYTVTMVGFAIGGILMGRLADRFGILMPLRFGAVAMALGYGLSSQAATLWQFALLQGALIGMLGSSASFGPVISDITHWFQRRRGLAVAIGASGSYLAGTVWPPVIEHLVNLYGWRDTHLIIAVVCLFTLLPLSAALRTRSPELPAAFGTKSAAPVQENEEISLRGPVVQGLLLLAGLACCVAMAMPQVHIVAYCGDLGYGTARGAEMLSLMLFTGIVSRLTFGWIADKIGALRTLMLSSFLQGLSLLLFLPFDGLVSLYVVSALFGLAQGGIVPTYALVVRRVFPAAEAGTRVGLVLSATLLGMALGGWMSGAIYDLTLSYDAAFLNGVAWNVLNLSIAFFLWFQLDGRRPARAAGAA